MKPHHKTLSLIFAVCAAPFVLAWIAYYFYKPDARVNFGEILPTKRVPALQKDNTNVMFVTTFYAILDIKTGTLTYTNAGHNPPHIIRKDAPLESMTKIHGMALAVMEDLVYKEDHITLNPGDTLFLYTDGVTEAENIQGTLFGNEKLASILDQYRNLAASELINTIRSDIVTYANGYPQSDDITMLAIRYLAGK